MNNNRNIEMFLQHLQQKNLAKGSIYVYKSFLQKYLKENWKIEDLIKFITNDKLKANSQSLYKAILSSYFKFFKMEKELKILEYLKLKKPDITYIKVIDKETIYQKCKESNLENQKVKEIKTIIKFLFETGIRISEISTLEKQNNRLFVKGKGNKRRQIFYLEKTLNKLKEFFPNLKIRVNYHIVLREIKRMFGADSSFHTFRRSFATYMLTSGSNVKSVMLQMGHKDIKTTYRYLNLDEEFNKNNYMKFFSNSGGY